MKRKLEGHFIYSQRWDYIVHFMFQLRLDSEKYFTIDTCIVYMIVVTS